MTMRLDPGEFRARPLRVHALLHDVPLEDAWAIPLSVGLGLWSFQGLRTETSVSSFSLRTNN